MDYDQDIYINNQPNDICVKISIIGNMRVFVIMLKIV